MFHLLFLLVSITAFQSGFEKFSTLYGREWKIKKSSNKGYIMRMSHEIFNMEWSNRDSITCILGTVSSIRLSPDQLKDF